MIEKRINCLYCLKQMESITAKKKFCSNLHRVYWNREKNYRDKETKANEGYKVPIEEINNVSLPNPKTLENNFHKPVNVENEPKENTNRFFLKYGFFTYAELKNKKI